MTMQQITDVTAITSVDAELGALLVTLGRAEGKTANAAKAVAIKCIALGYTVDMLETPAANTPVPLSFRQGLADFLLQSAPKDQKNFSFKSDTFIRDAIGYTDRQAGAAWDAARQDRLEGQSRVRSALGRVRAWLKKYAEAEVDENLSPTGNESRAEGSTRHGALAATKQSIARFADSMEKRLDEKKVEALNLTAELRDEYESALAGVISAIGRFEAAIAKCETHHAGLVAKAPKAFGEAKNAALDIKV